MLSRDQIIKILHFAAQAPSGDNAQPWRFEVQGNVIDLFNIPGRDYSPYNFKERGSYFAQGALIENFIIAATSIGCSVSVDYFPNVSNEDYVAQLTLVEGDLAVDPLFACIGSRVTNRRSYQKEALSSDHQDQLLSVIQKNNPEKFFFINDAARIKQFAKTVSLSDQLIFEEKSIHDAIFHSIRWTEAEEEQNRGMYIKTLELPLPARAMFRVLRNWSVLTKLNRIGISKFIASQSAGVYATAATLGMIVLPDTKKESYVAAGRSFERFWLTATQFGIGIQPITALSYLAERVAAGDAGELSEVHTMEITQAQKTINGLFGNSDNQPVAMMFRMGYADEPSAHSRKSEPAILSK